jgi:hypothetical protein
MRTFLTARLLPILNDAAAFDGYFAVVDSDSIRKRALPGSGS